MSYHNKTKTSKQKILTTSPKRGISYYLYIFSKRLLKPINILKIKDKLKSLILLLFNKVFPPVPKRLLKLEKVNKVKKSTSKEIVLPLYFGWELVIRRIENWQQHIIGPFKKYWQYMSVVMVFIVIIGTFFLVRDSEPIIAGTYSFTQTGWTASSTNTGAHTTDQSGWTDYWSEYNVATSSGITISR